MMWDALLRLHDRDVERRFWVSPAVKGTLLSVDRGAVLTVLVNNASLVHYVTRMVSDGALDPWVLHFCYMQAMFYVASQLAVSWWATAKPDQYYRRRDLVVFGLRVARFFGGIVMMVPPGRSIGGDAFLPPYVLGPGSAWFKVARLLVQRSAVAWALFITAQFPVRFSLNVSLHLYTVLPLLLHAASRLALVLLRPEFQEAVCCLAGYLTMGATPRSGCHPLAPQLVAYAGAVSLGIVTPLFLSYVIEARLKLRFLRQHYPAVCTQSGVFCQNAALDIAACAFLYVNFCVLANMLVCIVVITVTGGSL